MSTESRTLETLVSAYNDAQWRLRCAVKMEQSLAETIKAKEEILVRMCTERENEWAKAEAARLDVQAAERELRAYVSQLNAGEVSETSDE